MKLTLEDVIVSVIIFSFLVIFVLLPMASQQPRGVQGRPCLVNLRQMEAAKNEWALENGKTNSDVVTYSDLTPYIQLNSKGRIPECPQGGTYIIRPVGENPICSLHGDLIKSNSIINIGR